MIAGLYLIDIFIILPTSIGFYKLRIGVKPLNGNLAEFSSIHFLPS